MGQTVFTSTETRMPKKNQKNANSLAKFADRCRELLSRQQIEAGFPGSILADIQTMIDFIGTAGIPTGSKQGNLPTDVLPELNARISQPVELSLKRPLLRDYPNLAGLYILLRVMNFARTDGKRLEIHPERRAVWDELNSAERYFALLESWLLRASGEVIGAGYWQEGEQYSSNLEFLAGLPTKGWKAFDEWVHVSRMGLSISPWNAQLQARFGLIELAPLPLAARQLPIRGWMLGSARRTPWGEAAAWAVLEITGREADFFGQISAPEAADYGFLQPAFRPFFPQWERLWLTSAPGPRSGVFIFKVSLDPRWHGGGAWRRLAVPGDTLLESLAYDVLKAFNFDNDHLHLFKYRDQLGKAREYHHSYMDEGPYSSEITVGESGLPEKEAMLFKFDFGDDWRFLLRLEKIAPPEENLKETRVLASEGAPPEQYPRYE